MRFYGNGIVWDKSRNRPLVHFKEKTQVENADDSTSIVSFADVEDEAVKNRLLEAGYKHEPEKIVRKVEKDPEEVEKDPEEVEKDPEEVEDGFPEEVSKPRSKAKKVNG